MIRKTVSTSKPATRLIEYAKRLSAHERRVLVNRMARKDRVIIFHIHNQTVRLGPPAMWTGERVSLAETEVALLTGRA